MITNIEEGVAAFVNALIATQEPPLTLEARSSLCNEVDPKNKALLIITADLTCEAGNLWKGPCKLVLRHPSEEKLLPLAHLKRCEAFIAETFVQANAAALKTAIETAAPGWTSGGFFPGGWKSENDGVQWVPFFLLDPLAIVGP
jgi:hypothetical protein